MDEVPKDISHGAKKGRPQTANYNKSFKNRAATSSKEKATFREVSSIDSKDFKDVSDDGKLVDPSNVSDIKSKDIDGVSNISSKDFKVEV